MNSLKEKIKILLQENCLIEYPVTIYMNHLVIHLPDLDFTQNIKRLETQIVDCANTHLQQREEDVLIEMQSSGKDYSFKLKKL